MVAPTLVRASDSATDPEGKKYGAPDIVEIVSVIEGNHPDGERIQAAQVENAATTNTDQTISGIKTFSTAPVISTISNSGTVTIPTGTNTLATIGSAQIITSKTMRGRDNTFQEIVQSPEKKSSAGIGLHTTASTWGMFGHANIAHIGTVPILVGDATDGTFRRMNTAATVDTQSGWRFGAACVVGAQNPRMRVRFRINTNPPSALRLVIMFSSGAATAPSATSDDPLANLHGYGLTIRSTESTFRIGHNDGSATGTYDDTTISVDNNKHTLDIYSNNANSRWQFQLDGGTVTNTTTAIPTNSQNLGCWIVLGTSEAVSKQCDLLWNYVEWDNIAG